MANSNDECTTNIDALTLLFNTTPTTDIIKLHHTSNLNKHSTVHFAQTVECLQEKYIEIFEMMCMPLYEELKGGELFRVIQHIQYGYWSDESNPAYIDLSNRDRKRLTNSKIFKEITEAEAFLEMI